MESTTHTHQEQATTAMPSSSATVVGTPPSPITGSALPSLAKEEAPAREESSNKNDEYQDIKEKERDTQEAEVEGETEREHEEETAVSNHPSLTSLATQQLPQSLRDMMHPKSPDVMIATGAPGQRETETGRQNYSSNEEAQEQEDGGHPPNRPSLTSLATQELPQSLRGITSHKNTPNLIMEPVACHTKNAQ